MNVVLRISGEVAMPRDWTLAELDAVAAEHQVADVRQLDPRRPGTAVRLAALLEIAGIKPTAAFVGLHGSLDDFHASIPLGPVHDTALVIYRVDGEPLSVQQGGPFRFFIPNHAACQTHEIDECANVKFLDHIELTREKGFDNRPSDDEAHARLHAQQNHAPPQE